MQTCWIRRKRTTQPVAEQELQQLLLRLLLRLVLQLQLQARQSSLQQQLAQVQVQATGAQRPHLPHPESGARPGCRAPAACDHQQGKQL